MTANEIRRSFLKYFERQGHRIVPSSPLVPHDDPTLLFTNAGMNQFKDVFLGKEKREYRRATSAQKCMRVSGKHNDLDNVGPSFRHHTFFEMLGNFSFGDYFKADAIPFAWTLLTDEWKLAPTNLYATVFRGESGIPPDEEAYSIWRRFLPESRIGRLGAADNFWQMGETGPCGRCSEVYYFRGSEIPCRDELAGRGCQGLECSCDRYVEIWNNVFMEFDRQIDGRLKPLPAPSIDTGMGLERITAVLQGTLSNYDTDLFAPLLDQIGNLAGLHYGASRLPPLPDVPAATEGPEAINTSMRVVADHIRAMTFLIADGVVPSNEWRGYVLRKIMRRAMRHGKRLGLERPLLHTLVDTVVDNFGDAYPELQSGRTAVREVVRQEEDKFEAVLRDGLPRLEHVLDRAAATNGVVRGDTAFRLYETFGVPRDFIEDMTEARKLKLDIAGFDRAMEDQREKARTRSSFKENEVIGWTIGSGGVDADRLANARDQFVGYDKTTTDALILGVFDEERKQVSSLTEGNAGYVVLDVTPFYLESGGQVSDSGWITGKSGRARVERLERMPAIEMPRAHRVVVESGSIRHGEQVAAVIDVPRRDATRRHHTATHLLHAALRQVLGAHVKQAGSLVAPDRLRFDFVHFSALTREQLTTIERIVNEQILRNAPVETEVRSTQEAIAAGAMALFGEKYGDRVRVVSVPGFSVELCGGTHVHATGEIGLFTITSEGGVAAGVRRIEAVTGMTAVEQVQLQRDLLEGLLQTVIEAREHPSLAGLKAATGIPDPYKDIRDKALRAVDAAVKLHVESRRLERENQALRMKAALGGGSAAAQGDAVEVSGVKVLAREVSGLDKEGLRALVDQHRTQLKSGVVVLASPSDGKVAIVVGVTADLTNRVPAGQVVKQLAAIVGGGGGGRPDFAEAGGKDPTKIGEMLSAAPRVVRELLNR